MVHDGGTMRTTSFCKGPWNTKQTPILLHRTLRRLPMEVALYARVSRPRQQQLQTIDQQRTRLREEVASQPEWHGAEEPISLDDGYRGARLNRPGLDRLRDRAAMAAFARVLLTTPDR